MHVEILCLFMLWATLKDRPQMGQSHMLGKGSRFRLAAQLFQSVCIAENQSMANAVIRIEFTTLCDMNEWNEAGASCVYVVQSLNWTTIEWNESVATTCCGRIIITHHHICYLRSKWMFSMADVRLHAPHCRLDIVLGAYSQYIWICVTRVKWIYDVELSLSASSFW